MTCQDARERFSDWADEALTAEERVRVGAHLAQCADCRKELERFTAAIALLHRMERPRAPVGFVDRVLGAARTVPWHRRLLRMLFLPLSVKLPAEAAALLLVAGLAVYVFQRTPELQRAARQEAFRPVETPPVTSSAPPPAEVPSARPGKPEGQPSTSTRRAERTTSARSNEVRDSASDQAATVVPPPASSAPAGVSTPSVAPERGLLGKEQDDESLGRRRDVEPSSPAVFPSLLPPPSAPSEGRSKTARPPTPPLRAAAPAPGSEPEGDLKKEAKARSLDAPSAQEAAPSPPRPAPAIPRSAARVLPSSDVVGRLAVKDRDSAERALGALLARSGGSVISRREDAGATVMEVAVPGTTYPAFREGLARLGVWRPEGEPSELPRDVRVTLRLVE